MASAKFMVTPITKTVSRAKRTSLRRGSLATIARLCILGPSLQQKAQLKAPAKAAAMPRPTPSGGNAAPSRLSGMAMIPTYARKPFIHQQKSSEKPGDPPPPKGAQFGATPPVWLPAGDGQGVIWGNMPRPTGGSCGALGTSEPPAKCDKEH